MAKSVKNKANLVDNNLASSYTPSFTTSSGDNLLVVALATFTSRTFSSVTFNGSSMTQIAQGSSNGRPTIFYLASPSIGNHTLSITMSGSTSGINGYAFAISGAETTPYDTYNLDEATSGTSISNSVTVAEADSLLIDFISDTVSFVPTVDGGQTYVGYQDGDVKVASSYEVVASGSQSSGWTFDATESVSQFLAVFKPQAGAMTATVSSVTLTSATHATTVTGDALISPNSASLTFTTGVTTASVAITATVNSVSLTMTPNAVTTGLGATIAVNSPSLTFTSNAVSVIGEAIVSATSPTLTYTSNAVTIEADVNNTIEVNSLTLTSTTHAVKVIIIGWNKTNQPSSAWSTTSSSSVSWSDTSQPASSWIDTSEYMTLNPADNRIYDSGVAYDLATSYYEWQVNRSEASKLWSSTSINSATWR